MKKYLGSLAVSASLLLAATVGGAALFSGGCGSASRSVSVGSGGGASVKSATTGAATLSVQWPARTAANSRVIPVASNSLIVQITFQGKIYLTQVLKRSDAVPDVNGVLTSHAVFDALPVGQLSVRVYAVPDDTVDNPAVTPTDAQASAIKVITVLVNKTTSVTVTLNSTIKSLVIVPQPTTGTDLITYGATQTFDVEAYDGLNGTGNLVLISPQTLTWRSENPVILNVTPHTTDTGVDIMGSNASGDTRLTVSESESGLFTALPVSVRGPLAGLVITTLTPVANIQSDGLRGGVVYFGYLATDAAGFIIPGASVGATTWTATNFGTGAAAVAIDSNGRCVAQGVGSANITVSASGFTSAPTTISVTSIAPGTPEFNPVTVNLKLGTSQRFDTDTVNPLTAPSGVPYSIVPQTGVNNNQNGDALGTLRYSASAPYFCVYTAPATLPTATVSGVTSTITKVQIQAANGSPAATVTLQ